MKTVFLICPVRNASQEAAATTDGSKSFQNVLLALAGRRER